MRQHDLGPLTLEQNWCCLEGISAFAHQTICCAYMVTDDAAALRQVPRRRRSQQRLKQNGHVSYERLPAFMQVLSLPVGPRCDAIPRPGLACNMHALYR